MKKIRNILLVTGIVLIVLCVVIGGIAAAFLTRSFPKTKGSVVLDGVTSPVTIYRDSLGTPHIYGENEEDVYFAQGYSHAQDRFYQMDMYRRLGAGRLSEFLGENSLGFDIWMRSLGLTRLVRTEFELMDESSKKIIRAYCAGINAYLKDKSPSEISLEYALLKIRGTNVVIEPWKPEHTLTWTKVMSIDLGFNMGEELYVLKLLKDNIEHSMIDGIISKHKKKAYPTIILEKEYTGPNNDLAQKNNSITPEEDLVDERRFLAENLPGINDSVAGGIGSYESMALGRFPGIGSNSWVVSGKMTESGKPILANDTHLAIQLPSVWYENSLHYKGENVAGFSFPGVPGVVIGHNDSVAWAFTINPLDMQDLVFEKINPANPNQYLNRDRWLDMEIREESIYVSGQPEPKKIIFRKTHRGPVISDIDWYKEWENHRLTETKDLEEKKDTVLTLEASFLHPTLTVQSILKYNRAKTSRDFVLALKDFHSPALNILYASTDGTIGYRTVGNIPIRSKGKGFYPVPGWTGDYYWKGYIPFEELPALENPEKGYIVTANNKVIDETVYPYYLGDNFQNIRSRRITDLIEEHTGAFTIDTMAKIQADVFDLSFIDLKPYLPELEFEDPAASEAFTMMKEWDGNTTAASVEAFLFNIFTKELVTELFKDQIPGEFDPLYNFVWQFPGIRYDLTSYLFDPESIWLDDITTPGKETPEVVIKKAFLNTMAFGRETLGENFKQWEWGKIHRIKYYHRSLGSSGIPILEKLFNRGPYAMGGSIQTVNSADWSMANAAELVMYSANRMIVDLGRIEDSVMVNSSGQSGHTGHPNYDDSISLWLNNEYHPHLWDKEDIAEQCRKVLLLKPAP